MIESHVTVQEKILYFLKSSSFVGMLTITALLVSFNRKAFDKVFEKKGFVYWSLFFALSLIPLAVFLFFWQVFFLRKNAFEFL